MLASDGFELKSNFKFGCSGGAVLDSKGLVVGMLQSSYTDSSGSTVQAMDATSINMALSRTRLPKLGVVGQVMNLNALKYGGFVTMSNMMMGTMTSEQMHIMGTMAGNNLTMLTSSSDGYYVTGIEATLPSDLSGGILLSIDGQTIGTKSKRSLFSVLHTKSLGDTVTITYQTKVDDVLVTKSAQVVLGAQDDHTTDPGYFYNTLFM